MSEEFDDAFISYAHLDNVELVEGRNRELRRLFDAAGHEPTRIHRISFGEYELGDLQPGKWREVPADKGNTGE